MVIDDVVSDDVLREAIGLAVLAHSNGFDRLRAFDSYLYHVKFIDDVVKRRDYLLDCVFFYKGGEVNEKN